MILLLVLDEARERPHYVAPPQELEEQKRELEAFLYQRVYRHEDLVAVRKVAQEQLRRLFDELTSHPDKMPRRYAARVETYGVRLAVSDYLAGMTDQHFQQQFAEIVGK